MLISLHLYFRQLEEKKTITEIKFKNKISIPQLENREVYALSVWNEKLLVGHYRGKSIIMYNDTGNYIDTIALSANGKQILYDAVWGRFEHIIVANGTANSVQVYSISQKNIIKETQMKKPSKFSVFNTSILLADNEDGVFQSTDDGITWSHVFQIPDNTAGWQCWQVMRADTKEIADNYWVLEKNKALFRLRIYTSKKLKASDVDVNNYVNLLNTNMAFDGKSAVLLCDYNKSAVHIFSANGEHQRQLIADNNDGLIENPWRLYIDRNKKLFYIGMGSNVLKIYTLTYAIP